MQIDNVLHVLHIHWDLLLCCTVLHTNKTLFAVPATRSCPPPAPLYVTLTLTSSATGQTNCSSSSTHTGTRRPPKQNYRPYNTKFGLHTNINTPTGTQQQQEQHQLQQHKLSVCVCIVWMNQYFILRFPHLPTESSPLSKPYPFSNKTAWESFVTIQSHSLNHIIHQHLYFNN